MSGLLVLFDMIAGVVLVAHGFVAIVQMGHSTRHSIRTAYIVLAVGAIGMLLSPAMDADWRRYSHAAVIMACAAIVVFDQRKRHIMSLGS